MFEDACTAIVALKVNGIGPQQVLLFFYLALSLPASLPPSRSLAGLIF